MRRRRPGGTGGGGGGRGGRGGVEGERWAVADGECWRGSDERGAHGRDRRVPSDPRGDGYDDGGVADELEPGLLSSPPHRAPPPLSRSRRWADDDVRAAVHMHIY